MWQVSCFFVCRLQWSIHKIWGKLVYGRPSRYVQLVKWRIVLTVSPDKKGCVETLQLHRFLCFFQQTLHPVVPDRVETFVHGRLCHIPQALLRVIDTIVVSLSVFSFLEAFAWASGRISVHAPVQPFTSTWKDCCCGRLPLFWSGRVTMLKSRTCVGWHLTARARSFLYLPTGNSFGSFFSSVLSLHHSLCDSRSPKTLKNLVTCLSHRSRCFALRISLKKQTWRWRRYLSTLVQ